MQPTIFVILWQENMQPTIFVILWQTPIPRKVADANPPTTGIKCGFYDIGAPEHQDIPCQAGCNTLKKEQLSFWENKRLLSLFLMLVRTRASLPGLQDHWITSKVEGWASSSTDGFFTVNSETAPPDSNILNALKTFHLLLSGDELLPEDGFVW